MFFGLENVCRSSLSVLFDNENVVTTPVCNVGAFGGNLRCNVTIIFIYLGQFSLIYIINVKISITIFREKFPSFHVTCNSQEWQNFNLNKIIHISVCRRKAIIYRDIYSTKCGKRTSLIKLFNKYLRISFSAFDEFNSNKQNTEKNLVYLIMRMYMLHSIHW